MKCIVCGKPVPADRLKITNVKTCSKQCSGARQGELAGKRLKSYRQRIGKTLQDIPHEPLVPGGETLVRNGHVVALQDPGADEGWRLVTVLRATNQGRATHVCAPTSWGEEKPLAENQLSEGMKIAVLPPEWAQDQGLAVLAELAEEWFDDLDDLCRSLAPESPKGRVEENP